RAADAMNQPKLDAVSAKMASNTAAAADSDASMKPRRRPMARMSMVAGIVADATVTTMIEIGSVASAGLLASLAPMIPPSVTTTIDPVADISWQVASSKMFHMDARLVSWPAIRHMIRGRASTDTRVRS